MQNVDKIKEMIKRFSSLKNEFDRLSEQRHQINKRLDKIETEITEIRNYLYRGRTQDFIQAVAGALDNVSKEDITGEYGNALNELKEIIELWLKDYAYYTRYGIDHLTSHQRKESSGKIKS